MFLLKNDEKSSFQVANDFYNYAKALAILRENLSNYREPASSKRIVDMVTKAMGNLVEQIQKEEAK